MIFENKLDSIKLIGTFFKTEDEAIAHAKEQSAKTQKQYMVLYTTQGFVSAVYER